MNTRFEYSAGAFVYRIEGRRTFFLVLQKQNGEYDLPKGHIEKGEDSEDAARREIKEETGLDAQFAPFFHRDTRYFFYEGRARIAKWVRYFLSRTDKRKVTVSSEHAGYEWVEYDDAVKKLGFRDLAEIMPQVAEYIRRLEEISRINKEYAALPGRYGKWELSRRFVPGEGRLDACMMLIGQAPGANEDEQGRPFIGRSGRLLGAVMRHAGMDRKDAYITSVVQFFPPKNRLPTKKEVGLCMPFLKEQIGLIRPRYVVLLGNLASESVLGIGQVEKNHGRTVLRGGITYLITLHPAAALRFGNKVGIMERDFDMLSKKMKKD